MSKETQRFPRIPQISVKARRFPRVHEESENSRMLPMKSKRFCILGVQNIQLQCRFYSQDYELKVTVKVNLHLNANRKETDSMRRRSNEFVTLWRIDCNFWESDVRKFSRKVGENIFFVSVRARTNFISTKKDKARSCGSSRWPCLKADSWNLVFRARSGWIFLFPRVCVFHRNKFCPSGSKFIFPWCFSVV